MTLDNEAIFAQALASEQPTGQFPNLSLAIIERLKLVQLNIQKDPRYLQKPGCPYDPRSRAFLEEIFRSHDADETQIAADVAEYFQGSGDIDESEGTYNILIRDAKRAYLTLSKLGQKMEDSNKPEEQLNKVKNMVQLQERLMAVIEKAEGFKQIQQFKRTIMEVIEQVLTPDQRTRIMEQIAESLK